LRGTHPYRRFSKAAIIGMCFFALSSSGCILTRILKMERQLCEFDHNFSVEVREGIHVVLREPILLDGDVTWIIGTPPTDTRVMEKHLVMTYLAEKEPPLSDPKYGIPIELHFVEIQGQYRLKEVFIGRNLSEVFTPELILQCMKLVCRSKKSILERTVEIDFTDLDPVIFPSKEQVKGLLGKPHYQSVDFSKMAYNYVLKTDAPKKGTAHLDMVFNQADGAIQRVDFRYLRYRLSADILERKAFLVITGS